MGQERECRLRQGRSAFRGKAYLETDFLLFRGEGLRLKIPFSEMTAVSSGEGWLKLEHSGTTVAFELGDYAPKWVDKILHPPTLLDKLGIKRGIDIAVIGDFEVAFLAEIGTPAAGKADILFFAARKTSDLRKLPKLISQLKPRGVIWVVYPKGIAEIREAEVISAGRFAGLKDTKVARFSETHTALRFSQQARPSPPR